MKHPVERAFELAPECGTMADLRTRLRKEGHADLELHLGGLATQRQLRKLFNKGVGQRKRGPASAKEPDVERSSPQACA